MKTAGNIEVRPLLERLEDMKREASDLRLRIRELEAGIVAEIIEHDSFTARYVLRLDINRAKREF